MSKIKELEYWATKGDKALAKGDSDEAINNYSKIIELNPSHAILLSSVYLNRGLCYRRKGLYDEAIEDYTKTIELDLSGECGTGKKGGTYLNRGIAYSWKELYEKAIEDFSKAIELNPDWMEAYYHLARQYKFIGNSQKAEENFKMVERLKLSPLEGILDIGKSGDSLEEAIIIFDTHGAGIHYEYLYLNIRFGGPGYRGYKLKCSIFYIRIIKAMTN